MICFVCEGGFDNEVLVFRGYSLCLGCFDAAFFELPGSETKDGDIYDLNDFEGAIFILRLVDVPAGESWTREYIEMALKEMRHP